MARVVVSQADRNRIAERHARLEQDTLPGMPKAAKRKPPRAAPGSGAKAAWKRLRLRRSPRCPECIAEYEGGVTTLDGARPPVRSAAWERTAHGEKLLMCHVHAEPLQLADKAKAPRKPRRTKRR